MQAYKAVFSAKRRNLGDFPPLSGKIVGLLRFLPLFTPYAIIEAKVKYSIIMQSNSGNLYKKLLFIYNGRTFIRKKHKTAAFLAEIG